MRTLRSLAAGLLIAFALAAAAWGQNAPPRYGALSWREPVATLEDLPGGGGSMNELGDCRLVRDVDDRGLYCWFNEWVLIVSVPPSGGYGALSGDNTWTGSNGFGELVSPGGATWLFSGEETGLAVDISAGGVLALDMNSNDVSDFWFDYTAFRSTLPIGLLLAATLPTCDAALAPAGVSVLAVDTTGPDLCLCSGSAWAPVDGSGTCV